MYLSDQASKANFIQLSKTKTKKWSKEKLDKEMKQDDYKYN